MATILTKKSDTASAVPLAADLTNATGGAELAVNATDKRLFSKTSGGTVVELGTNPSSLTLPNGTANGLAFLNASKVVTSGSALTFDGTNLGVGTTSPAAKLGVAGNIFISGASSYIAFDATQSGSTPAFIQYASNSLVFGAGSSEQMRLTSTGLGIGTSSPAAKLHVVGNTRITADIESTGNSIVYSSNGSAAGTINAGIYLVGSDSSSRFYTGNSERMRLDSSGNLGLGVTPSAWSGMKAFQLGDGTFAMSSDGAGAGDGSLTWNGYYNGTNWIYSYTGGGANRFRLNESGAAWLTAASGTAGNAITWTQAMTLDASGNLGIGTTSPSRRLSVYSTNSIPARFETNTSDTKIEILTTSGTQFIQGSANNLLFGTNNTEAARIDSSGNLLVGTTATVNAAKSVFSFSSSNNGVYLIDSTGVSGAQFMRFDSTSNTCGSITRVGTTSAVAYNTSSDYRLKNTIAPMTGALAKVALLKPCTYKWNADGSDGEGFIAHELAEVVPQCVTGEKDAVDDEGNPKYQGIDVSFLVATLTAAIQELKAEFDAYKASHP